MWTHSLLGDVLKWPPDLLVSFFPYSSQSKNITQQQLLEQLTGSLLATTYAHPNVKVCSDWLMQYFRKCTITAYGLGFCDSVILAGWNSTPVELWIVTRAITDTSAVIRVRLSEGISHVPVPVTHDPLSGACAHTHTTTCIHTSVPPAHTWNQSVDTEPGLVLSKM